MDEKIRAYWGNDENVLRVDDNHVIKVMASLQLSFACLNRHFAQQFIDWASAKFENARFTLDTIEGEDNGLDGDAPLAVFTVTSAFEELFNIVSGFYEPIYQNEELPWVETIDLETLMVRKGSTDFLVPMVSGWIEQFCNFYDMACAFDESKVAAEKMLEAISTQNETVEMLMQAINELRSRVENHESILSTGNTLLSDNDLVTLSSLPTIRE